MNSNEARNTYKKLNRLNPLIQEIKNKILENLAIEVPLPDHPTDDDLKFKKFCEDFFEKKKADILDSILEKQAEIDLQEIVNRVGWGWWGALPQSNDDNKKESI